MPGLCFPPVCVARQIAALGEQIAAAKREYNRIEPLVEAGVLATKMRDDAGTQVDVLEKQLAALQSSLEITRQGLQAQTEPLMAQIAQLNDQIARCTIVNPINGTVLITYAKESEVTAAAVRVLPVPVAISNRKRSFPFATAA